MKSHHDRYSDEPLQSREYSPPSTCSRECDEDGDQKTEGNVKDTYGADEEDAGLVSIIGRLANEVWM
jgi:hypothetical protein